MIKIMPIVLALFLLISNLFIILEVKFRRTVFLREVSLIARINIMLLIRGVNAREVEKT
jgi:hypothetical protein